MSVYRGPAIAAGLASLVEPTVEQLRAAIAEADLTEREKGWLDRAQPDEGCLYFAVELEGWPIGQVLLHDVDWAKQEALVAYHIFRPKQRGQGYGAGALGALGEYAFRKLGLQRLVVITTLDNAASRRIAEKCGFREIGPAREGPDLVVYELLAQRAASLRSERPKRMSP